MIFRLSRSTLLMTSTALLLTVGVGGNLPVFNAAAAVAQEAPDASGELTYLDEIVSRGRDLLAPGSQRDPAAAAEFFTEAAKVGSTEAMLELSRLYARGDGVPADFDRARQLIEDAIAAGEVKRGPWFLAELYARAEPPNRDMNKAVEAYQAAADLGDPWSMVELGRILATGDGVPADFVRATELLRQAIAIEGESRGFAYETLGDALLAASGADRDVQAAIANFRNASDLGSTGAMFKIAAILRNGDGVPVDAAGARDALLSAIAAGAAERGWLELGTLYASGPPEIQDAANAAAAFERAVELGNPWAMIELAGILGNGNGVPADLARAEALLRQAASLGGDPAPSAFMLLGDLHRGPGKNPAKALEAYRAAVDLGSGAAMLRLAAILRAGEGVPADFGAAQALLRQAIEAGQGVWGWAALGALAADPNNPDRNMMEAAAAYAKAAELGDPWSMVTLGEMLSSGEDIPVDYAQAIALLTEAGSLGGDSAPSAYSLLGNVLRSSPAPYQDLAKAADAFAKAAVLGDAPSMLTLARMYRSGEGVAVDHEAARKYFQMAIDAGAALQGWAELGSLHADPQSSIHDPAAAIRAYQAAVDLGDSWSTIALARLLAADTGNPTELARAVELLEGVANQGGDAAGSAYLALGDLYLAAPEPDRDPTRAAAAYGKGAEQGDTDSMFRLAAMLSSGKDLPLDFDRARGLLEQAVAAGEAQRGWAALGTLYASATPPNRDIAKAVEAYEQAATLGDPWSAINLAQILGTGEEVEPAFDRATALLWQAATSDGDAKVAALTALGDLYRTGYEPSRNGDKAVDAYRRAIEVGSTATLFTLASMYREGNLIPQDIEAARLLYEQAIDAGEARRGWLAMGDLYAFAPPGARDTLRAANAYQMASNLGDPLAMVALAKLISDGDGVPRDPSQSVKLLEAAIAASDEVIGPAHLALADIYRANPELAAEPDSALKNYVLAAGAGEGRGHLLAGELIAATVPFGPAESEATARHFTEAARMLDVDAVTKAMFGLKSAALYATVQRMLADRGYRIGAIDGVLGPQTVNSIKKFCADQSVASCSGLVVGYDLLKALLSSDPAG